MRTFKFNCENCKKDFVSEYPLDVLLPRCIPVMCDSCVNDGAVTHAKEAAHSFIDRFFTKLLGK